ncbi:hypothetical protein [Nocardia sp. XZ_19_385]|uniref:hypothetical protein n=1 Tax=Nocardia sp. XZ_19_385 TaxID=2769488 RepID=UPI00188DFB0B|nr:hypothetical protein [Nocardia sp. XZ_19_385]
MKLLVLLADSAQVAAGGKVHALGLGWNETVSPTPPMALVMFLESEPGERLDDEVRITGALVDGSGEPAQQKSLGALQFQTSLQVGADADRAIAVVNFGPGIPLEPGSYAWVLSAEEAGISSRVPFTVQSTAKS